MRAVFAAALLVSVVSCGGPAAQHAPNATTTCTTAKAVTSLGAATSGALSPPAPPPDAVAKIVSAPSHAFDIVHSLTTEVGPRSAGSIGDAAAVAWALRTLAANGLTNVHAEKAMVRHWERGAETAEIVAPVHQPLKITALGGSVATPPAGIEAEVVEITSMDNLSKLAPGALAGKIAFLDAPMRRAIDGAGYGDIVPLRSRGAGLAQKAGAIATILRSVGTDHNRLPHTGAKHKDDVEIPAGALSVPDAELLHDVLQLQGSTGAPVRVRLTLTPRMLADAESANVVGEVRGREKPDEVVLLGAHLDSWDLGTGAIDDGAGCGIVIDAARRISTLSTAPRRTVRVVLFADEENGREGGDAYAKVHASEAEKIVVALEADFGGDRVYGLRFLGGAGGVAPVATIATFMKGLGVEKDAAAAHGGTDIAPLRTLGVPIADLRQDGSRYFDFHHTANDTIDKVDREAIAQAAAAFGVFAWGAAESDGDFGRIAQEERAEHW